MGWLMREPQLLVWLSTLYRLKAAEKGMVVKAFFRLKSLKNYNISQLSS